MSEFERLEVGLSSITQDYLRILSDAAKDEGLEDLGNAYLWMSKEDKWPDKISFNFPNGLFTKFLWEQSEHPYFRRNFVPRHIFMYLKDYNDIYGAETAGRKVEYLSGNTAIRKLAEAICQSLKG